MRSAAIHVVVRPWQDSPLRAAANSTGGGLEPYLGAACSSMGVQYSRMSREKDLAEKLFRLHTLPCPSLA
jgi:hypothetical protein